LKESSCQGLAKGGRVKAMSESCSTTSAPKLSRFSWKKSQKVHCQVITRGCAPIVKLLGFNRPTGLLIPVEGGEEISPTEMRVVLR
jgi:hypothetical protein